ncbi:MAG: ABC transporter ATP-binding protein [Candidatus Nealsonbacteria bacterium]|nr:MAG: ABC transporter ATP-binding protein [Candidatus Nealsonbacteria bacterium]
MQIALSVKNISKKFGNFTAVDNVSFEVEDGKFFSILGPSGCGKTTLLRMIAGFLQPDTGSVEISGKNMLGVEPNKRPVNLVFQNLALFPMMNVYDNIAFGLRRRGERGKSVEQKVNSMLKRVGLPDFGLKKINQISGGQKQRIAIARCLVLEPSALLLDEPLGALDAKLREHMKVELKKLQAEVGTTFVYITHDQSEAMVMSDYVAVMNAGHFEQLDTPQNLYSNPSSAFVAQFVGKNNKFIAKQGKDEDGNFFAETEDGHSFKLSKPVDLKKDDDFIELYIRPEAMIINPKVTKENFNILDVTVKALLFDGGNSRLLVEPENSKQELIISLPQNRQFDYIKAKDRIKIGWDPEAAVCFKKTEGKIYEEL